MMELFTNLRVIKFFFQIIAFGFKAKYCDHMDFTSSLVNLARLLFYVPAAEVYNPVNSSTGYPAIVVREATSWKLVIDETKKN